MKKVLSLIVLSIMLILSAIGLSACGAETEPYEITSGPKVELDMDTFTLPQWRQRYYLRAGILNKSSNTLKMYMTCKYGGEDTLLESNEIVIPANCPHVYYLYINVPHLNQDFVSDVSIYCEQIEEGEEGYTVCGEEIELTYTTSIGNILVNGATAGYTYTHELNKGEDGPVISVKPTTGYRFVSWSDGVTTNERQDTNVQESKYITAESERIDGATSQPPSTSPSDTEEPPVQSLCTHEGFSIGQVCLNCSLECYTKIDEDILMYDSITSSLTAELYNETGTGRGFDAFCRRITKLFISNKVINLEQGNVVMGKGAYMGVEKVIFEEESKLEYISRYFFAFNEALTEIEIPKSVKHIDKDAFYGCEKLKTVSVEDGIKLNTVGDGAFMYCNQLENISLGNSDIKDISSSCLDRTLWWNNQQDNSVVYLDGICLGVKGDLPLNTSVEIRPGTMSIANNAFVGETGLRNVRLPESLKNLGNNAFNDCLVLLNVTTGGNIEYVGSSYNGYGQKVSVIFKNTPYLENAYVDGAFYLDKILHDVDESITECNIREGTTIIHDEAFAFHENIHSITIPSSIKKMGAFFGCEALNKVNYTGTIDQWVEIDFASSEHNPTYYANDLYINDILVTDVEISVAKKINSCAFINCDSLENVVIGESVTSIEDYAFWYCDNIKSIDFVDATTWYNEQGVQLDVTKSSDNASYFKTNNLGVNKV